MIKALNLRDVQSAGILVNNGVDRFGISALLNIAREFHKSILFEMTDAVMPRRERSFFE